MLSLVHFRSMRRSLRSLIYLFWIYSFVTRAVTAFAQIYIFQVFDSVELTIVATIANITGIMIGFCVYGAAAAQCRLNAKHGFFLSFLFTGLGLILLPLAHHVPQACAAMAVRGVGIGLFWLTIHTYELMETSDHERDIYSTFLSAGDQVVLLAGPAFATLLIWLSHHAGIGDFTLLFLTTPLIFLLGLPGFAALKDYRPAPIGRHDIVHFFADRRNQAAQIYLMGGSASFILQQTVLPLAAITVLGSALNVGGFNTVFAIAGALALLAVGSHRRPGNRLFILGLTSIVLVSLNLMLGWSLTIVTLIVYAAGTSVTQPIMRVSQHVIDLKTMDGMSHHASDFYPAMIMRDVALWVWRTVAGLILLAFASGGAPAREAIAIGMYMTAGAIVVTYAGARILLTWRR
jgi:hypothetical protein